MMNHLGCVCTFWEEYPKIQNKIKRRNNSLRPRLSWCCCCCCLRRQKKREARKTLAAVACHVDEMRVHTLYTLYRHILPHGMRLHLCLCCACFFQLVHEFKNKMQSKTNYMYVYIKGCTLWQSLSVCLRVCQCISKSAWVKKALL